VVVASVWCLVMVSMVLEVPMRVHAERCKYALSQAEFSALQNIYFATDGPSWQCKSQGNAWNFSDIDYSNDNYLIRPCNDTWTGVHCYLLSDTAGPQCSVFSLDLSQCMLDGTISSDIGSLENLMTLSLGSNSLTGSLPSSIQYITNLQILILEDNYLEGAIPSEIGLLTRMSLLSFQSNSLQFGIPSELFALTDLIQLELGRNHLTGRISTYIGQLKNLTLLSLSSNLLEGQLPTEMGLMTAAKTIQLDGNMFSGTIPSEFGSFASGFTLELSFNSLRGSIPNELWAAVASLMLASNELSSTLATEIATAARLDRIDLSSNHFYGTIPSAVGLLPSVAYIILQDNHFVSPIPTEIFSLQSMNTLMIGYNRFSSTIPSEMANMLHTSVIGMESCGFFGQIPSGLENMKFSSWSLSNNHLTGSLPAELSTLTTLVDLHVDGNMFSGPLQNLPLSSILINFLANGNLFTATIPENLNEAMNSGGFADIGSNYLSGPIRPVSNMFFCDSNYLSGSFASSGNFSVLQTVLSVANNMLSGPMFPVQRSLQSSLQVLSIANNALTGQFPSELLALPGLEVIIASGNCFSGELLIDCGPGMEWCQSSVLSSASLNGLSSGYSCRIKIVTGGLKGILSDAGYMPREYLQGNAPISTLFQFPSLTNLYLEGNGFQGQLPDIPVPSTLRNFSISCNQLTGPLPAKFQDHSTFESFDASHNRFSGTLTQSFQQAYLTSNMNTSKVDITSNRLSGKLVGIGNSVDTAALLTSAMKGNLLWLKSADTRASDVDQGSLMEYNGSENLNAAISVSISVFTFVFLAVVVRAVYSCTGLVTSAVDESPSALHYWISHLKIVFAHQELWWNLRFALYRSITVGSLILVVSFVMIAAILKLSSAADSYSTHLHQYNWQISFVFTHGLAPAVCINVLLVVALICIGVTVLRTERTHSYSRSGRGDEETEDVERPSLFIVKSALASCRANARQIAVITLVVAINLVVVTPANLAYLVAILNNVRHLLWVQLGLSLFKCCWNAIFLTLSMRVIKFETDLSAASFRYFVMLLNLIVVPSFLNSLVSEECFLQLFEQTVSPTVTGVCYSMQTQTELITRCSNEVPMDAPFTYSYQCSSALIMNYVPVLLYTYVITGFIRPALMLLSMVMIDKVPERYYPWLSVLVPRIVLAVYDVSPVVDTDYKSDSNTDFDAPLLQTEQHISSAASLLPVPWYSSVLLLDCTMILTFGLAYPYLAVVIVFGHANVVAVWLAAVGRYHFEKCSKLAGNDTEGTITVDELRTRFQMTAPVSNFKGAVDLNDAFCDSINGSLRSFKVSTGNVVAVISVCFLYWGLFCFDMIADVHGIWNGITAMALITTVCPLAVVAVLFVVLKQNRSETVSETKSVDSVNSSMQL
jgi:Leucine-rich repeat (LRR) protein